METVIHKLECGLTVYTMAFNDGATVQTVQFERAGRLFQADVENFDGLQDAVDAMKSVKGFFCGSLPDYNDDLQLWAGALHNVTVVKPEYLFPEWGC